MSGDFNVKLGLFGPYELTWPCHPLFYTPPHLKIKDMRHNVLFLHSVPPCTNINIFFKKIFRYNSRTTVRTLPKLPCLFSSSLIRETASLELWHLKSSSLRIRIWTNGSMHIKFQRHFVRLRRQQIDRDREDKSY